MSFILKALKKVEQEQADRKAVQADLQSAILTGRETVRSTHRLARWGGIILVFVAGSVLTYLFMQKIVVAPAKISPQAVVSARPIPLTAPVPDKTAPAPGSASIPATAVVPEHTAINRKVPASPSLEPPQATSRLSGRATPAVRPARPASPVARPASPVARPELTAQPPADLKVNGIAFQDDPADSVAVVNGALLKKGMSVGGARIEGIFRDRVRFSGGNGIFEVQLTK
jgi:hypothetical protein